MPPGLDPKVWWIGIGINDLLLNECSEKAVVLGVLRVAEEIRLARPNAVVVINSVLPIQTNRWGALEDDGSDGAKCHSRLCDVWPSIARINRNLRVFASRSDGVDFFDADDVFVRHEGGPGGATAKYLRLDLMDDPVHPNAAGHRRWNRQIVKRLRDLIG